MYNRKEGSFSCGSDTWGNDAVQVGHASRDPSTSKPLQGFEKEKDRPKFLKKWIWVNKSHLLKKEKSYESFWFFKHQKSDNFAKGYLLGKKLHWQREKFSGLWKYGELWTSSFFKRLYVCSSVLMIADEKLRRRQERESLRELRKFCGICLKQLNLSEARIFS